MHPEFKGQRVRYAEIYVDFDGRRPIAVQRAVFRHLAFDESGRLDEHEWQKYDQLFAQTWPRIEELEEPHITNARAERAHDEIDRQFGWQPTPALRDQLYDAALHNRLVGGYRH